MRELQLIVVIFFTGLLISCSNSDWNRVKTSDVDTLKLYGIGLPKNSPHYLTGMRLTPIERMDLSPSIYACLKRNDTMIVISNLSYLFRNLGRLSEKEIRERFRQPDYSVRDNDVDDQCSIVVTSAQDTIMYALSQGRRKYDIQQACIQSDIIDFHYSPSYGVNDSLMVGQDLRNVFHRDIGFNNFKFLFIVSPRVLNILPRHPFTILGMPDVISVEHEKGIVLSIFINEFDPKTIIMPMDINRINDLRIRHEIDYYGLENSSGVWNGLYDF